MNWNWIIKPNRWYDNQNELFRFLLMINVILIPGVIGIVFGFPNLHLFTISFLGIYRISAFIIVDTKRFTKPKQSETGG